jgi:hypothetical protein
LVVLALCTRRLLRWHRQILAVGVAIRRVAARANKPDQGTEGGKRNKAFDTGIDHCFTSFL